MKMNGGNLMITKLLLFQNPRFWLLMAEEKLIPLIVHLPLELSKLTVSLALPCEGISEEDINIGA